MDVWSSVENSEEKSFIGPLQIIVDLEPLEIVDRVLRLTI
jgi:hypothetical protein